MTTKTHIYNDMRTEGNITRRQIDLYELLANAVIELAVQDYRMLRSGRIPTVNEETQLNMKPELVIQTILKEKEKIVKFFRSTWYSDLTSVKADYMLERLNAEPHTHWKPTNRYVEVNPERLDMEIKKRNLGNSTLFKLTGVKSDYFFSIVRSKRVIIPIKRAKKIADGLGIPQKSLVKKNHARWNMRKVLIVGWIDFDGYKKLAETYTDVLFVCEARIRHTTSYALIELVGMFDQVLFVGEPSERITYEVACAMKNVQIAEMSAYPVEEEEDGEENAETV